MNASPVSRRPYHLPLPHHTPKVERMSSSRCLLLVSDIAWTTFLILLLPAFCISYCIRQIGLLLAQHRRSSLVETLSSLSLHYLHGEDAGRNIVVVIYLGAPGIKIAALKKLLVKRIFSTPRTPSGTHQRRNCGSKGMERWFAERL
ncbi:unnamed protein product [Rodentolepis nana]|uniref:Uncharacterized protein n=1 Tax=Rodentolepis nana TaxID=102285 RepID=A0A0R3T135_RODNA|nr:unnamed protein product [Rodentolepis nana]